MATPWTGPRKVAFVPIRRTNDIWPGDWHARIKKRVDSQPVSPIQERAVLDYIRTTSYGRAVLEWEIREMVTVQGDDMDQWAMAAMREHLGHKGFSAGIRVFENGQKAGPVESWFWGKVSMSEGVGLWAKEIIRILTYINDEEIKKTGIPGSPDGPGLFDNLAAGSGSHLSAYTKRAIGWLDSSVHQHNGGSQAFNFHSLSQPLPLPPNKISAVQVGRNRNYFMVESRERTDRFDGGEYRPSPGAALQPSLPSEGLVVYKVISEDSSSEGGSTPKIELLTKKALTKNESFVSWARPFSREVGIAVKVLDRLPNGGFVAVVDELANPRKIKVDRTAQSGSSNAVGVPSACAVPGLNQYIITHNDHPSAGKIQELWRDTNWATGRSVLMDEAQAANAAGNSFALQTRDNVKVVLYRDIHSRVRSVWFQNGVWGTDNLMAPGAPAPAYDPVGAFHQPTETHYIVYRTSNNHIHKLYWYHDEPVQYGGDLTAQASAPAAEGQPAILATESGKESVIYRGPGGDIYSLYWNDAGELKVEILNFHVDWPKAVSDPVFYYTPYNRRTQVFYVGTNKQINELFWANNDPVQHRMLTRITGAEYRPVGTPAAFFSVSRNTHYVVYRSVNKHLNALWWFPGGFTGWYVYDLNEEFQNAPVARDRPIAFCFEATKTCHAVYRAYNDHILELIW